MDWGQIGGTLAKIGLTGLGTAFGGPLGGTIGGALGSAIADALGVAATPEAVNGAITANPDLARAKLADLESARQSELALYQAEIGDRQGARAMQVSLAQESVWIGAMPAVQSAMNWAVAVGVVVGVAMGWLREDGIVVGFGIGAYAASNSFWLGSSSGSKRNADAVRSIAAASTAAPSAGQVAGQAIEALTRAKR